MPENEYSGELYSFDMGVWEPVTHARGSEKGEHPTIQKNGSVYVDKSRAGEDVRVFIRKQKKETKEE